MSAFALLLAIAAQASPQPAPQPAWRPIGAVNNGRQTYYDPASIIRAGPLTRLRLRTAAEGTSVITTVEFRCAAYESRILGTASFDASGAQIGRNEMATPFRAIVAGGFFDTLAREICGAAQGPAGE